MSNLPQVIILYGPPAAGKGTQALKLKQLLPDYYHLDFGTELRNFVNENIGDYSGVSEEKITVSSDEEITMRARRIRDMMKNYMPVETPDLRFVVEKRINDTIVAGQKMLIEGPGRKIEEAKWLSEFFAKKGLSVAIFHLHLELEEVVKRSTTRYYIPDSKQPYPSYQLAKKDCKDDQEPFQRPEDTDSEGISKRYKLLYSGNFAQIISVYQLQAKSLVLTLDASKAITEVTNDINTYLKEFFDFDVLTS